MSNLKYIGKNVLNHTLELKKGNVSGSATSTGSFGEIRASSKTLTINNVGTVSGSSASTGSFGRIDASARIYESGTSVIDHATAMAIVFGG